MLAEVNVACGSTTEADAIARALVEQRLAACAQTWPIRSIYRWQGEAEQASEVQLVVKTRAALVDDVCAVIAAMHSYDTPAIAVVHGAPGTTATEAWLREETGGGELPAQGMQPQHKPE